MGPQAHPQAGNFKWQASVRDMLSSVLNFSIFVCCLLVSGVGERSAVSSQGQKAHSHVHGRDCNVELVMLNRAQHSFGE